MDEAYRITLEYDGETYSLKSMRKLAMRVPPGQAPDEMEAESPGHFVELRGAKGKRLYRRHVDHILPRMIEFPTGDPARPFGWGRTPRPTTVSLLVPAAEGARSVALVEAGGRGETGRKGSKGKGGGKSGSRLAAAPRDLISVDLPREREAR